MELNGLKGLSAWLVYVKIIFSVSFLRRFNVEHNKQLGLIEALKLCKTIEQYKDIADKLSTEKINKIFYTQAEAVQIFKESSKEEKEKMLFECLTFVDITDEDSLKLLAVHKDKNGIPFSKANILNMKTGDIIPLMLETLIACSDIDCDFSLLSEDEIEQTKKYKIGIKDEANEILTKNSNVSVAELIPLSVKKVFSKLKGV